MALPKFRICDKCGAETTLSMFVCAGRQASPAGEKEDRGANVDLCGEHWMEAAKKVLEYDHLRSYDRGELLLDWIFGEGKW